MDRVRIESGENKNCEKEKEKESTNGIIGTVNK